MPKKPLYVVVAVVAAAMVLVLAIALFVSAPTRRAYRLFGPRVITAHYTEKADGPRLRVRLWSGPVKDGDIVVLLGTMEKRVSTDETMGVSINAGGKSLTYDWSRASSIIVKSDGAEPVAFTEVTRADLATALARPWRPTFRPWSELPAGETSPSLDATPVL